ncbi:MAG: hypothetical protein US36_C0014G0003 [Candidatus Wolfebacteria bacterium GW2011_GWC1_37_10]|uniref:Uncharacterized protein n=1 Tax=Candidatus Wolfebacteria bacterium GW2011_GWC1_37_10 TaxID=1619010 RepID=A0A0G0FRU1_9BACT|nr:MAG: hypothetical protein US36_C0014G0003 [Candidatus Wolfebacteria bacterium GW2011_GWC1_37_10]
MKFNFIISKWANFYFFASNLTEWHFSCRKDYNLTRIKETGPPTEKELVSLNEFKKILLKYKFDLAKIFYIHNEKEIWQKLEKIVKKSEFEKIESVFKILKPRFELIWKKSEKQLNKRVILFKSLLNKTEYQNLLNNLCLFFDNKKSIEEIGIIALISPLSGEAITAAGGANIDNKHITLEIPDLKINNWELEYSFGIIAHEIAHLLFKRLNNIKIINKIIFDLKIPKKMPKNLIPQYSTAEFITELIIELLVPFGYLSQKYFKNKPTNIVFSKSNLKNIGENYKTFKNNKTASSIKLRKLIVWQLYPLISFYIESNKKIDKNIIKEFTKFTSKIIWK